MKKNVSMINLVKGSELPLSEGAKSRYYIASEDGITPEMVRVHYDQLLKGMAPILDVDFFSGSYSRSEQIGQPIKIGDIWTNIISSFTSESVNFKVVTTWEDGGIMDDSKVDDFVYRKRGDEYLKLIVDNIADVRLFGASGDGVTDDTHAFIKAKTFYANSVLYVPVSYKCYIADDLNLLGFRQIKIDGEIAGSEEKKLIIGDITNNQIPCSYSINRITGVTLQIQQVKNSDIQVRYADKIRLFADGSDTANSIAYSNFTFNRVGTLEIIGEGSGWINENSFYKCRFFNLLIDGDYAHNHNVFYNPTFENTKVVINKASWNYFYNARFEGTNSVTFGENATENTIFRSWFSSFPAYLRGTDKVNFTDAGRNNQIVSEFDKIYLKKDVFIVDYFSKNYDLSVFKRRSDNKALELLKNNHAFCRTNFIKIESDFGIEFILKSLVEDAKMLTAYLYVYDENKQLIVNDVDPGVISTNAGITWRSSYYRSGNMGNGSVAILKNKGAKYIVIEVRTSLVAIDNLEVKEFESFSLCIKQINRSAKNINVSIRPEFDRCTYSDIPDQGEWVTNDIVYNNFVGNNKKVLGWIYKDNVVPSPTRWLELGLVSAKSSGTTEERPTGYTSFYSGIPFFDVSLKKPIWWDGAKWIDSSGNTV